MSDGYKEGLPLARDKKILLVAVALGIAVLVGLGAALLWRRHRQLQQSEEQLTIHPPVVTVQEELDGKLLTYRRFQPNMSYSDIELPDLPFFIGVGDPDQYKRLLRYSSTTNSQGFRGPRDFSPRKAPGTFRVACIGDGITFGEGVDDTLDFPYLLQDLLNRGQTGRKYEVLNLGIPSRLTDQALDFFRLVRGKYDADFYFICLGTNDALPMFDRSPRRYEASLRALLAEVKKSGVDFAVLVDPVNTFFPCPECMKKHKAVFQKVLGDRYPLIDLPGILDRHERQDGRRFEEGEGNIQRLVQYGGGRPKVLISTRFVPRGGPNDKHISPVIYDYLDNHKVYLRTFITDCHLNERGHRVVARELSRHLERRLKKNGR